MELIPLTKDGFHKLQHELEHLKSTERPNTIREIADARAHGDLRENAEYHAAREKQAFIEARISELEDKLSRAEIIEIKGKPDTVRFGAWVTLSDEETGEEKRYQIVGELEADINAHKLSVNSPIAKALLGKQQDDTVEITVPKGKKEYVVIDIAG